MRKGNDAALFEKKRKKDDFYHQIKRSFCIISPDCHVVHTSLSVVARNKQSLWTPHYNYTTQCREKLFVRCCGMLISHAKLMQPAQPSTQAKLMQFFVYADLKISVLKLEKIQTDCFQVSLVYLEALSSTKLGKPTISRVFASFLTQRTFHIVHHIFQAFSTYDIDPREENLHCLSKSREKFLYENCLQFLLGRELSVVAVNKRCLITSCVILSNKFKKQEVLQLFRARFLHFFKEPCHIPPIMAGNSIMTLLRK